MTRLYHISFFTLLIFLTSAPLLSQIPDNFPSRLEPIPIDTLPSDSQQVTREFEIIISPDSIDAEVVYGSVDSNYLSNKERRVYLFGNAFVTYKDLRIEADYIVVDLDSSIATAEGMIDSTGKLAGTPVFKVGEETINAERMRYNFKTRKGFISDVLLQENDLFIRGEKSKYIAGGTPDNPNDPVIYNRSAIITSCDAKHPHYGIRARKAKMIPDKLAVVGTSNLELFGVPTPLILPFGFYPVPNSRQAGVLIPRDYEQSPSRGFGLKDFGYYFPHRDWAEVRLTGDVYFNGSWGLGVNTNYVKKYKYRGTVDLRYSNLKTEPQNTYVKLAEKSFSIRISHNQDPKAHPYQTIGGSVNIQSNDFESLNYNDAQSALTSSYSSNFNYSRTFPNKPYSFTAGINHSQNTRTHLVTINAPEFNFRLNRIYPFKIKNKPGPDQWYEKIAFQYSGLARSQVTATDTTLFDRETWENFQYGAQHKANANVNFSVLKIFNVTPSVDYGETWFFKTRQFDFKFDAQDTNFVRKDTVYFPDGSGFIIQDDTINRGIVEQRLVSGFQSFRTFSAGVNMNTQLFSTLAFSKGWLRGIRYVVKPTFGFFYSPKSPESYYDSVRTSISSSTLQARHKFENLLYGVRPVDQEQMNFTYGFNNIFEGKYFSRRDSTDKKFKIFDNISASGNYNFAADSFQFSPVTISGNARFFKGITTLSVGAGYSFYGLRENGRLNSTPYLKTDGKLLRFNNLSMRFSSSITFTQVLGLFNGKTREQLETERNNPRQREKGLPSAEDKFFDLLNGFSINHEILLDRRGIIGRDTFRIAHHTINMVGSMRLTPNWSINFGNIGYDFESKELTYPDIGISRNLHCWQLSFSTQPTRGTYSFHIGVRPGSFDFLKFPYRRGNYDAVRF